MLEKLSFHGLRRLWPMVLALGLGIAAPDAAGAETANAARALLLSGRYGEALKAYERVAGDEPLVAAIGAARCRSDSGCR